MKFCSLLCVYVKQIMMLAFGVKYLRYLRFKEVPISQRKGKLETVNVYNVAEFNRA